jgi:gliding motility-associated-like protein
MNDVIKGIIIFFMTLYFSVEGQNLVQNAGFEINTGLPSSSGQWDLVTDWGNANSTFATPDYFHINGSGNVQLPNSIYSTVNPFQGNAVMGMALYYTTNTSNYREYISQTLASPLTVGAHYTFSFYITNGVNPIFGGIGIQNVQVDFAVNPIVQSVASPLAYLPLLNSGAMTYSNNWIQISYNFQATAPFSHFAIGNFDNDANTVIQQFENAPNLMAYYFIDEVSLTLNTNNVYVIGDNQICLGDSVALLANNSASYAWADSLNPNIIIDTDSVFVVCPEITTTYFVYGNTDTTSFTVYVTNPPIVNLGNDTSLCIGNNLLLNATSSKATYLWQDNSTNSTYNVSQPATYWVNVTVNNCVASDTIYVNYNPNPLVYLGNDTSLCAGETLVLDAQTTNALYLWNNNTTNPAITVSEQGVYWVNLTLNNCIATDSIAVIYKQVPLFNLGSDTSLCSGETIMLNAQIAGASYLWQDNSSNQTFNVSEPGIYWVIVTNNNCIGADTIKIGASDCEIILEMPNVLTPNNDGENDRFFPSKYKGINEGTLGIYNRWGQKMVETTNLTSGWDGKSDGNDCMAGTYFWIINFTTIDNEAKTLTGFLTLLR